jgi:hypothetical protein
MVGDGLVVFEDVIDGFPVGGKPRVHPGLVGFEFSAVEGAVRCDGSASDQRASVTGVAFDRTDTASERHTVWAGLVHEVVGGPAVIEDHVDVRLMHALVAVTRCVIDRVSPGLVVNEGRHPLEGCPATVTGAGHNVLIGIYP